MRVLETPTLSSHHLHCRAEAMLTYWRQVSGCVRFGHSESALLRFSDSALSKCQRTIFYERIRRRRMQTVCALNTGSEGDNRAPFSLGTTRLQRAIQDASRTFLHKFNSGRNNFPLKIFCLLLGLFASNALATVIGQTGDWDVLISGILVAVIEFAGQLMYRMPPFLGERGKEGVVLMNFFKAGVSFGLFVDAFKLGS